MKWLKRRLFPESNSGTRENRTSRNRLYHTSRFLVTICIYLYFLCAIPCMGYVPMWSHPGPIIFSPARSVSPVPRSVSPVLYRTAHFLHPVTHVIPVGIASSTGTVLVPLRTFYLKVRGIFTFSTPPDFENLDTVLLFLPSFHSCFYIFIFYLFIFLSRGFNSTRSSTMLKMVKVRYSRIELWNA